MTVPLNPKIYHIVPIDTLPAIIQSDELLSDSQIQNNSVAGTVIGMDHIKKRRLEELTLTSHPNLYVGQCVPFYFCPRSIMLYIISMGNHTDISYIGGQQKILHLEADLNKTVAWAEKNNKRWAFTLSNAGAYYFEDRNDLQSLNELNWTAIQAIDWSSNKNGKQAEFLVENNFPWELIERIGTYSNEVATQVENMQQKLIHKPSVETMKTWYY